MTVGMRNRVRRLEGGALSPKRFYLGQPFEEIVSQLAHFGEIGDLKGLFGYYLSEAVSTDSSSHLTALRASKRSQNRVSHASPPEGTGMSRIEAEEACLPEFAKTSRGIDHATRPPVRSQPLQASHRNLRTGLKGA